VKPACRKNKLFARKKKWLNLSPAGNVWYCNAPLGKHKLENLLFKISKKAGLTAVYTSHCLRATSVTILNAAGLENATVKLVTDHNSDSAVESYHKRRAVARQVQFSAIIATSLQAPLYIRLAKKEL